MKNETPRNVIKCEISVVLIKLVKSLSTFNMYNNQNGHPQFTKKIVKSFNNMKGIVPQRSGYVVINIKGR